MNFDIILKTAIQFQKFAYKLDPFRNINKDIMEALAHADINGVSLINDDITEIPMEWLNFSKIEKFPLRDALKYDDYNFWGEFEWGQLKKEKGPEVKRLLRRLRGRHAEDWNSTGIPAIIILDFPGFRAIGDGRGRVNFAVGMGYQTVPAVIVSVKSEFQDQIKYNFE